MKYLIDAHNTISAGTLNLTHDFIKGLLNSKKDGHYHIMVPKIQEFEEFRGSGTGDVSFTYIPQFRGLLQFASRLAYQLIIFPAFVLAMRPDSVLILGNYSIFPWSRKIVFVQQQFLTDDTLYNNSDFKVRLIEGIVRVLFRLTLMSTSKVIVQHERIKKQLISKYDVKGIDITIVPTPVSDTIRLEAEGINREFLAQSENIVLYVSRYYGHKNHRFIIKVSERYSCEFRDKGIIFFITLDPTLGKDVEDMLNEIKHKKLDDIIRNLSEVPQQEVVKLYRRATLLFFPSKAESFGLPLVEAMAFGLPVVVPDLDYAHAVCGKAGVYYKEDDVDDAYRHLIDLCKNRKLWEEYSKKSIERFKIFPTADKWVKEILGL